MKEKMTPSKRPSRSRGAKIALISVISLWGLLLLLFTSTGVYLWTLFGKVTYDDGSGSESYVDLLPEEEDDSLDSSVPDLSNPGELDTGAGAGDIRGNTQDIVNYLLIGVTTGAVWWDGRMSI